jgi:hypothetical protein
VKLEKMQIQTLAHGYQDCHRFFQNVMSKIVQDMEYVKTYLDDLLILTNRNNSFKDHLFKLEMVLARLSTAGMRVNISKSKFLSEQIEYQGILDHQTLPYVRLVNVNWLEAHFCETTCRNNS